MTPHPTSPPESALQPFLPLSPPGSPLTRQDHNPLTLHVHFTRSGRTPCPRLGVTQDRCSQPGRRTNRPMGWRSGQARLWRRQGQDGRLATCPGSGVLTTDSLDHSMRLPDPRRSPVPSSRQQGGHGTVGGAHVAH
jgi:hypothetical protein